MTARSRDPPVRSPRLACSMPNVKDHNFAAVHGIIDNIWQASDRQPDAFLVGHLRKVGEFRQLSDRMLDPLSQARCSGNVVLGYESEDFFEFDQGGAGVADPHER